MSVTFLTNEDEKKYVKSVNGAMPDEDGNVEVEVPSDEYINELIDAKVQSSGGTTTETVTKTGKVVSIEADDGADIVIEADTPEVVVLYHSGKNMLPCNLRASAPNGMTIVKNDDGKVTFRGVPTATVYADVVVASDSFYLPVGNYTLESFDFPVSGTTVHMYLTIETIDGSKVLNGTNAVTVHGLNGHVEFVVSAGAFIKAYYKVVKTFLGEETTCGVMLYMGAKKNSQWEMPVINKTETTLPATVTAHDGINVLYTATDNVLTASMERTITGTVIGNDVFDASDYALPVLNLDGSCDGMTKDDYVSLKYSFMGMTGMVEVKKQGSSSIQTGIEIGAGFDTDLGGLFNFTLKFPEAFEAKSGWGAQKKYHFKANAIDHSHARNICSCKLWGEIVKSRANVPTELSNLINGGAIDGFPIVIVLNGKFYALGTFNIPKDRWMFGSPKAILCADAHVDATKFKALATLNGDFELEYVEDEDNADWVLTSINRAIQAVMNSDGSNIDATVGQYIDIPSAIDYYIHTVDENANDGTDKNYILVTFDGVKWYFSAYDRDTVYGLYWNGKTFTSPRGGITYAHYATVHRLMELLYTHKKSVLKARAIALRDGIRSEINVCNVFTKFAAEIPAELLAQNCRRWPLLRSTNASNIAQILNWYRLRRSVIDKEIDAM